MDGGYLFLLVCGGAAVAGHLVTEALGTWRHAAGSTPGRSRASADELVIPRLLPAEPVE